MAERLQIIDAASNCNTMLAAEHVVRYGCVRGLCRGRRVLDVACGEGYGSALLAGWGASEVVGVDISGQAIATARKDFNYSNVTFIQGDACRLSAVLGDVCGFDLVVSFGTIEHVLDVSGLLAGIRQYCVPQGTIVISCPNGHVEGADNPMHKRSYTFDEFRLVVTEGLGPASGWLLGAPAQGQILYQPGAPRIEHKSDGRMHLITECQELPRVAAIPALISTAPDADACTFYIGYWGGPVGSGAVILPQSHLAFVEPWRTLARFKTEREQMNKRQDDLRIAKARLERQVADFRRRALAQARVIQQRFDEFEAELAQSRHDAQRWTSFQQSGTYRLMQIYVRSYYSPVVGVGIRLLRRLAGGVWRSLGLR